MSLEAEVASAGPPEETAETPDGMPPASPAGATPGESPRARATWTDAMEKALWQYVQTRKDRESVSKLLRDFAKRRGVSVHTTRAKYYQMLRDRGGDGGGAVRNWSDEDDRLLMDVVREAVAAGGTLGAGLEQAAQRLNRSASAVRARYYRLAEERSEAVAAPRRRGRRPRRGRPAGVPTEGGPAPAARRVRGARGRRRGRRAREAAPAAGAPAAAVPAAGAPAATAPAAGAGQDLLPLLAAFLESAQQTPGVDLRGFVGGLAQLARLARVGAEAGFDASRLAELEAENRALKSEAEALRSSLQGLVAEFEQRDEVGRIAALGEFQARLRSLADRVGSAAAR